MDTNPIVQECENTGIFFTAATTIRLEERAEIRNMLNGIVNIAFYNSGRLYRGKMINLSPNGATMTLFMEPHETIPDLTEGRSMEYYVLSSNGRTKCRGVVKWSRKNGSSLFWGIEFIELSPDEDDPLHLLIRRHCRRNFPLPVCGTAMY